MRTLAGTLLSLALLTGQGHAATTLFDFETDAQIARWHNEGSATLAADKKLERIEAFAADGKSSMRFSTAAWIPAQHNGASAWPAFECQPPLTDIGAAKLAKQSRRSQNPC